MRIFGIFLLVLIGIGVVGAYTSVYIVNEEEQAILLEFGKPVGNAQTEPGLYVKLPYQSVTKFPKRILNLDPGSESFLLVDQRPLEVDYFVPYRINDPLAFFESVRTRSGAESRLRKSVNAQMRAALGQETLENILSAERKRILEGIQNSVSEDAKRFGLEIIDVRIGKADLPIQISQNVYERMRAERERLAALARAEGTEILSRERSKADLEAAQILANARREEQQIRGQAEAQAQRLLNEAYGQDPEFFSFLRSMDAYKATIAKQDSYKILSTDSEFLKRLKSAN
jgi:membrane protease subunit HflC